MSRSGGCQCGAVRFRVEGDLGRASICHCRMCQKAIGGPFGAFVSAPREAVTWTRGAPQHFQSSNLVRRGFCAACGTSLTFDGQPDVIDLAIFAFDDREGIAPEIQLEPASAPDWLAHVTELEVLHPPEGYYARIVSNQHPDRDR